MLVIHLNLGTNLTENTLLREQQIWRQMSSMFLMRVNFRSVHLHWLLYLNFHCVRSVNIRSFSSQYCPVFGLNAENYSEYQDLLCKSLYSDQTRENTDLKNSKYGHFFCSICLYWKYLRNLLKLQNQSDLGK